jgi:hypothetical protein
MKLVIVVLLFLFSNSNNHAYAQRAKVYTFKVTLGEDTIELPQVEMADTIVEQRINYFLQMMLFEVIAPPKHLRDAIGNQLWTEQRSGTTSLDYQVVRNDDRLLCLSTYGEYLGAYPSTGQDQVTFDLVSGIPVTGKDIFTSEGYRAMTTKIAHDRTALVEVNNRDLEKDTTAQMDSEEKAQIEENLIECAKDSLYWGMNRLLISDIVLAPDQVRCLPHADQSMDIDWGVTYSITSLAPYLNGYGKGLLLNQPYQPNPVSASKYELLKGTIDGKYPIIMILQDEDFEYEGKSDFGGSYFYVKKGTPLRLSGKKSGSTLELIEESEKDKPFSGFSGEYSKGTYKGIWHSATSDKKLKFELSRY